MKLHLATNEKFNYLNYLSLMSAIRKNDVVFWYRSKPESKWFKLVEKIPTIEFREMDPLTGITIDQVEGDQTGRLDTIYLSEFEEGKSIDDYLIKHEELYDTGEEAGFEKKDITLVKVHPPKDIDIENPNASTSFSVIMHGGVFDFLTPEYIRESSTLLARLIRRVLLERVWDPYGRQEV